MRKVWFSILSFLVATGISFASTYSISSKVISPNSGYVNISGNVDVANCSFAGCDVSYNLNINYNNFLVNFPNLTLTLNGLCTYKYDFISASNSERAEFICNSGTVNINGQSYALAITLVYYNGKYSGTLTLNGQPIPIDDSLGVVIGDIYLLFTFLNY